VIVIDTSVLVDYIFEEDENRNRIAKETLKLLKGFRAFAPTSLNWITIIHCNSQK